MNYRLKIEHYIQQDIKFNCKDVFIIDRADKNTKKIVQMNVDLEPYNSYCVTVGSTYRINGTLKRQYTSINIIPTGICISHQFVTIYDIKTYEEAIKLANYLKQKWVNFLIGYQRRTITLNTQIIRELPLDLDITDDNYIEYFDLTEEDVYNIECYARDTDKIKVNDFCK